MPARMNGKASHNFTHRSLEPNVWPPPALANSIEGRRVHGTPLNLAQRLLWLLILFGLLVVTDCSTSSKYLRAQRRIERTQLKLSAEERERNSQIAKYAYATDRALNAGGTNGVA